MSKALDVSVLKLLAKAVEEKDIEAIKDIVAKNGGSLACPKNDSWIHPERHELFEACIKACDCEVFDLLVSLGMGEGRGWRMEPDCSAGTPDPYWSCPLAFQASSFFGVVTRPEELPDVPPEKRADIKRLTLRMLESGLPLRQTVDWDAQEWVFYYADDASFLNLLKEKGVDYSKAFKSANRFAVFLAERERFDALSYLASLGYDLTKKFVLDGKTSRALVDFMAERGVSFKDAVISSWRSGEACTPEMLGYAFEKGVLARKFRRAASIWDSALESGDVRIADCLLEHGVTFPDFLENARPANVEILDWYVEHGHRVASISARCEEPVLLRAAALKIAPAGGMKAFCDSLDYDVIEAFLEAGITEGVDATAAVDGKRDDLLALYARHGLSTAPTEIVDGSSYIERVGESYEYRITVPQGIKRIRDAAFERPLRGRATQIDLPDGLEEIGENAFAMLWVNCVEIPKSVKIVRRGAFFCANHVIVYDSIDPDAKPAEEHKDTFNGMPNSELGWVGSMVWKHYVPCMNNSSCRNFEIIVKSATTEEVLYKVWMPLDDAGRVVRNTFASSWGRNATFAFGRIDELFRNKKFPNADSKVRTAINRLLYPVDLSAEAREAYERYLGRSAKKAVEVLCEADDVDALRALDSCGLIKKSNVEALFEMSKDAPNIRAYILHEAAERKLIRAKNIERLLEAAGE